MHVYLYIYIPVIVPVRRWPQWGGVGWGWDDDVLCTCTNVWCYVCVSVVLRRSWWGGVGWGGVGMMVGWGGVGWGGVGWGGVGWGGVGWGRSVHMYTCLMLRLCVCRATEIMVGWGGVGMGWWRSVLYRNDCSSGKISIAPKDAFVPDSLTWLEWVPYEWAGMNKKGCAKFLWNLKTLIFAFFMTGVVNRPPANGNNHPYIYICIYTNVHI